MYDGLFRKPTIKESSFATHTDVSQYTKTLPPPINPVISEIRQEIRAEGKQAQLDVLYLKYQTDPEVKAKIDNHFASIVSDAGYKVVETPDKLVFVNPTGRTPTEEVQFAAKFLSGGEQPLVSTAHGSNTISFDKGDTADYNEFTAPWHQGGEIQIETVASNAELHSSIAGTLGTVPPALMPQGITLVESVPRGGSGMVQGGGDCCIFNQYGGGGCGPCNRGSAGSIPPRLKKLHEEHHRKHMKSSAGARVTNCTCCAKSDGKIAKMINSLMQSAGSFNQSMNTPTTANVNPYYQELSTNQTSTQPEAVQEVKKEITLTPEQYDELVKAKTDKETMQKTIEDLQNEHKTNVLNQILADVPNEELRKTLFDKYFAVKDIKIIKDLYSDFQAHFVPTIKEKVKAEFEAVPKETPKEEKKQSAGSLKPEPKVEKVEDSAGSVKKINQAELIHKAMFGGLKL